MNKRYYFGERCPTCGRFALQKITTAPEEIGYRCLKCGAEGHFAGDDQKEAVHDET